MRLSDKFITDIIGQKAFLKQDGVFNNLCLLGKNKKLHDSTLTYLNNKSYLDQFLLEEHSAVVCTSEVADEIATIDKLGVLVTDNPKDTFFAIHNFLVVNTNHYGKEELTRIGLDCKIHETAIISSKNVIIGNNVIIGANVVIHDGVTIGDNSIIMEGCSIGTSAFYYFGEGANRHMVESGGSACIGKNVVIHPNTVICKGVLGGQTLIGDYTVLDSNIFVGHDVNIGSNCILAAGTTLGGWSHIGSKCFIGVGGKIAPNVNVLNNAKISIGAVVTKDVESFAQVSGNFAIPHKSFINNLKQTLQNEDSK